MDEDLLRQLLSQEGIEFTPTPEMMMMNSATVNDSDTIDPDLITAALHQQLEQQEQQQVVHVDRPIVTSTVTEIDTDDDLLLEDETILERIIALKEMFPESVQNAAGKINQAVVNTSKLAYNKGRTAAWW